MAANTTRLYLTSLLLLLGAICSFNLQCDPYFDDIGCSHPGCEPTYPTPNCMRKCVNGNQLWRDSKHYSACESIIEMLRGQYFYGMQVEANLSARKIVLEVCDAIVKQGGRLAGAGVVGILQKMEEDSIGLIFGRRTVVAMDGGLYEHYPQYRGYLQDAVTELLGMEVSQNVIIEHSKDGSGIGAALLAATNSKYDHN